MPDRISPVQRSALMSRVKQVNTSPELIVRKALFKAGFRYRVHVRALPGKPDIVLPKYRTVVFVHGCFWHGHDCRKGKLPATNVEQWQAKIQANIERDARTIDRLKGLGWTVEVLWECSLTDVTALVERLHRRA
ncbi:very short patch repair endonuclease [Sinorhizobium meliloti]|uniref:very short patch repair endonuclease n=1 Tax=Rhizobium meliloti TaxID=382 RepID=UPI00238009DA|nr:very short patch repair endonuclease [Sinorhizobium meliloti]MDE3819746.1 DNA mismatch endonuclease Vsr [Sinorhizobium meliloti]